MLWQAYTIALICLGLGRIWNVWLPINNLCGPAPMLYIPADGYNVLCIFIYFIDIKGKERCFTPFKAMCMNPLFAFVMSGVLVKLLGRVITWTNAEGVRTSALSWLYKTCCVSIFGNNEYASLMHALIMVAIFLVMCMALYRKKIFIKI